MGGSTNIQILETYIAGNGGDPWPYRGIGVTNDNTTSATLANNYILGNEKGGLGEIGASALTAQIIDNISLGNGGYDINLRGTDDSITRQSATQATCRGFVRTRFLVSPFDTRR